VWEKYLTGSGGSWYKACYTAGVESPGGEEIGIFEIGTGLGGMSGVGWNREGKEQEAWRVGSGARGLAS